MAVVRLARTPGLLPTEHQEQVAVVGWAAALRPRYPQLGLLFAIPNGARTAWSVARRLKAEGLASGVPDLFLAWPTLTHHGLFLEMKRAKRSATSDAQQHWIAALRGQGYAVVVCKGAEAAMRAIVEYLTLPPALVGRS